MKFRAKVDWWIAACICAGILAPLLSGLPIVSAISALIVLAFCVPQWYEITADALVICAGLITRRIPYSEIAAVRPSSDSRSSLALSLDRVLVEYGATSILIAPKDRDLFLTVLARHTPQLSRKGQDLVVTLMTG